MALSALRLKGYRSDRRYLVFQCLPHTPNLDKVRVRLFALCHERRNLAEYEGYMDIDDALLAELLTSTEALRELLASEMAAHGFSLPSGA